MRRYKTGMIFVFLIAFVLAMGSAKSEDKDWKKEALKWKGMAESYQRQYGWIGSSWGWCSMNQDVSTFSGYDDPNCWKPDEPWCKYTGCSDWEITNYRRELEDWVDCRRSYIEDAKADAGCALNLIREGIEKALRDD